MLEPEQEISAQLGITLDDDDKPLVVMMFPGIYDPGTDDSLTILVGDASDTAVFATQLLRAGQICDELSEALEGVDDEDDVRRVIAEYAKRMSGPYN